MSKYPLLFLLILAACGTEKTDLSLEPSSDGSILQDSDGDGHFQDEDCDDSNALVHPNANELCDGVDNNCDGSIDEGVTTSFYADADFDGFGNSSITTESCEAPEGFVANGSDCDDSNSQTYPGADEICDEKDNNCDSVIDEGMGLTFYVDNDGDGFGNANQMVEACDLRIGLAAISGDCDDNDPGISPAAVELCDGIDNNCNGDIDEGAEITYYRDSDGDGFGDAMTMIEDCTLPEGYVTNNDDCDDAESYANPNGIEFCDGIDNDCNGAIDEEGAVGGNTYYADVDGDGYGDVNSSMISCSLPSNYSDNSLDCDDTNSEINPSLLESCNGIDDNCDGNIDESPASNAPIWYEDGDEDGYGDANSSMSGCAQPTGYVSNTDDCDDNDDDVYLGAPEYCNGEDDNCDGFIDEEGAIGSMNWYGDVDGDGYGDAGDVEISCDQPSNYVNNDNDCDDTDANISPVASEICDQLDNDCDGFVDNDDPDIINPTTWYVDVDGDGYGDAGGMSNDCTMPSGYVDNLDDCDDNDVDSNPDATEICDGEDNDCDGSTDEDTALYGTGAACAALDCQDILINNPTSVDGSYWIDSDGGGAFEVYCDMSSDGGGWTLLGTIYGGDDHNWNTQYGLWADTNSIGAIDDPWVDYKSEAWWRMATDTAEVMYQRIYDGDIKAQMKFSSACQHGKPTFRSLFTNWDTSLYCGNSEISTILLPSDSTGLYTTDYQEGSGSHAIGGSASNGWCWNGGDTHSNTFQGHAGWNQSSYGSQCYASGHLGYIGVFSSGSSQYANRDIDTTNWFYGTDISLTAVSFFAR